MSEDRFALKIIFPDKKNSNSSLLIRQIQTVDAWWILKLAHVLCLKLKIISNMYWILKELHIILEDTKQNNDVEKILCGLRLKQ